MNRKWRASWRTRSPTSPAVTPRNAADDGRDDEVEPELPGIAAWQRRWGWWRAGGRGISREWRTLKFSREDERQADRVGLELMSRAGWDGHGMVEMFEILKKASGRDPSTVEAFFSTHPTPQTRIKDLSAVVAAHERGRVTAASFRSIKGGFAPVSQK